MLIESFLDVDNFQDLKNLEHLIIEDKIILARSKEVESRYLEVRNFGLIHNISNSDLVRQDIFIDRNIGTDGLVLNEKVILCRNKFSAQLPPDTEHWNLWLDILNVTDMEIDNYLSEALKIKNWTSQNTIIWEKKPNHRSVPDLRHLHIYVYVG